MSESQWEQAMKKLEHRVSIAEFETKLREYISEWYNENELEEPLWEVSRNDDWFLKYCKDLEQGE